MLTLTGYVRGGESVYFPKVGNAVASSARVLAPKAREVAMITLKTVKIPMLLARQLVPRATRLALEVACLGPAGPLVTRLASGTLVRSFRFGNFIRCLITQENPGQLLISSVVRLSCI